MCWCAVKKLLTHSRMATARWFLKIGLQHESRFDLNGPPKLKLGTGSEITKLKHKLNWSKSVILECVDFDSKCSNMLPIAELIGDRHEDVGVMKERGRKDGRAGIRRGGRGTTPTKISNSSPVRETQNDFNKYRLYQKTGPFLKFITPVCDGVERWSTYKVFSSLFGVRLLCWVSAHSNVLCISSHEPYGTENINWFK